MDAEDAQRVFFSEEILFPGKRTVMLVCETESLLLMATEDMRLIIVDEDFSTVAEVAIGAKITSLDVIYLDKFVLVGTD